MEIVKLKTEKKGQENEYIFCPLPWTHEVEKIAYHRKYPKEGLSAISTRPLLVASLSEHTL